MYDELVKRLRVSAEWADHFTLMVMGRHEDNASQMKREAADAIEQLAEDNAALNGTVANLIQQIAELSEPRWIPVTERLPFADSGYVSQKVLVTDGQDMATAEWFNFEMCEPFWSYTGMGDITHWMPLPEPPKEET